MYKILIVDDEPYIREGLKKIIDQQNSNYYVCGEAEDGTDALQIIERDIPDIVITDIRMMEMDGIELIRQIHLLYKTRIKFIILSAYSEFEYAKEAIKYGVGDYILKPIDTKELLESINKIVRKKEEETSNLSEYQSGIESMMLQDIKSYLYRNVMSCYSYEKMLNYFNIQEEMSYRCILVEFSTNIEEKSIIKTEFIKNLYANNEVCKIAIEENFQSYCLVFQESEMITSISDYYEGIFSRELLDSFKEKANIYFGSRIVGFCNIKESYLNTFVAMKHKFYSSNDFFVIYEDIQNIKLKFEKEDLPFLGIITEAIFERNEPVIYENTDLLFKYLKKMYIDPNCIKINLTNFALNLNKKITAFGGSILKDDPNELTLFNFSIEMMYIDKLKVLFGKFCIQCVRCMDKLNGEKPSDIVTKVQTYLHDHYKADIKITDLADEFYLNSVYLGQLFKKKTGVYINDYINELRIEEAKKLLKSTGYKVYEISLMVGFTNSDYFTTKFEKTVGVTPLHYRKGITNINTEGR